MGGAFQLVAAIRRVEVGRRIEAAAIRTGAGGLGPAAFLLEAVAQAAGWLIGASTDFARRGLPLGLERAWLLEGPPPGLPVEVEAQVVAWRDRSAVLRGRASCRGQLLCEAEGGLCALVAAEELEDPAATRAAYEALLAAAPEGAAAGATVELPGRPCTEALEAGRGRGVWEVTARNGLFADHFPRLPLLPGSLQVEALAQLARDVAEAEGGPAGPLLTFRQVRFRRPVRPGDELVLTAERIGGADGWPVFSAQTCVNRERAASIGEIHIGRAA